MITDYLSASECSGCLLCMKICPVNAIDEVSHAGFSYPVVNKDKCIACKQCVHCCPVLNAEQLKHNHANIPEILIARNKSLAEREKSTSGGVFIELARNIVVGGTVYGAEFETDWSVAHVRAVDDKCIRKFQGSKYIQSRIYDCYDKILMDLKQGRNVLFSGTPCQVSAVKSFVEKRKISSGKLITVEILCYGVPSPELFKEHVNLIERKFGHLKEYKFRDERDGWGHNYIHCAIFENGTELYNNKILQAYASLFSKRLSFRTSCFLCKFSDVNRCADITIGDCWGIEHIAPECEDSYGISQIWINTDAGKALWDRVADNFELRTCSVDALLPYNSVLSKSAEKPVEYDKFWKMYKSKGYGYVLRRFTRFGKTFWIRHKLKRMIEKLGI